MLSALYDYLTSASTVHADSAEEKKDDASAEGGEQKEKEDGADAEEDEEEEDEPEDDQPKLREECKQSAKCASVLKHFQHCEEKVNEGKGYKGEDCVEEFLMHCADQCAAPKLFSKLR